MDNREYKYDAFISYRHCELDKYVAENLHRILEAYDLPKNIKEKLNIKGRTFKRIFRDQDELPLSSNLEDPIIEALKDSKYLIVICSPRLKDSLWCKKEIETFKKLRGRKNIFCVLIEGEPSDSFPEEVLYDIKETTTKDGKKKTEKLLVEPLAADVRGNNKKEVLKKIKEEKLRLIAPMYNLDYDDLKQRHKLREQKRIATISISIAIACLLFALYSTAMFIKINSQQKTLANHQALSLAENSYNYMGLDNRYDAIKAAYEALTKFNGVKMPYTSEAEYALSESLGVYDVGYAYKSISEIKTKGVADYIKGSSNNKYVAVYDESEELNIIDSKSLDIIATYKTNGYSNERLFSFIGEDKIAFVNENGNISIVNISERKIVKEISKEHYSYIGVLGCSNGELLTYTDGKKVFIYNVNEDREIGNVTSNESFIKEMYLSEDAKYLFATTTTDNFDISKQDHLTIRVIRISDAKEINSVTFNAGYMNGILTKGENAYILLNNSINGKYSMLTISYNYVNGKTNWSKTYDNLWGKYITRSYAEGTDHITVASYDKVAIINPKNGSVVDEYHTDSEVINIYSFMDKEIYLVFLKNGHVNYIVAGNKNSIEYKGKFEFNLNEYTKVVQSQDGFILLPYNENRVILYEQKYNSDIKKEDIKLDYASDDSIVATELDKIREEYDLKNKNLILRAFYDTNKELLFVSYTNKDLAIYNVSDKKLITLLTKVGNVNHYFGKDKYGRMYVGDLSDSYIIDSKFNKVGHVTGLAKVDNDRLIILNNGDYYSSKIYTLDDLKKMAKDYLNK